jgi:hypothetical protein
LVLQAFEIAENANASERTTSKNRLEIVMFFALAPAP